MNCYPHIHNAGISRRATRLFLGVPYCEQCFQENVQMNADDLDMTVREYLLMLDADYPDHSELIA